MVRRVPAGVLSSDQGWNTRLGGLRRSVAAWLPMRRLCKRYKQFGQGKKPSNERPHQPEPPPAQKSLDPLCLAVLLQRPAGALRRSVVRRQLLLATTRDGESAAGTPCECVSFFSSADCIPGLNRPKQHSILQPTRVQRITGTLLQCWFVATDQLPSPHRSTAAGMAGARQV